MAAAQSHLRVLLELAQLHNLPVHYEESCNLLEEPDVYSSRLEAGPFSTVAHEVTKTAARAKACILMLDKLEKISPTSNKSAEQITRPAPVDKNLSEMKNDVVYTEPHTRPDFGLGKDPSSRLSELQMARKQPYAQYHLLQEVMLGSCWLYSFEASLDNFSAVGKAYTKKEAKRRASTALLHKMGYKVPEKDLLDLNNVPQISTKVSEPVVLRQPQTHREESTHEERSLENQAPVNQSQNKPMVPPVQIGPDFGWGKHPNSRLSELQMIRREKYVYYRTLEGKIVGNDWVFTVEASLYQFYATGSAFTLKEAKKRASTALLLQMGFRVPEQDMLDAVVMATHNTREEPCPEETSPRQEQADDLYSLEVTPKDLDTAPKHSESKRDDDRSQKNISPDTAEVTIPTPGPQLMSLKDGTHQDSLLCDWFSFLWSEDAETSIDSEVALENKSPGEIQSLGDSMKDTECPENAEESPLKTQSPQEEENLDNNTNAEFRDTSSDCHQSLESQNLEPANSMGNKILDCPRQEGQSEELPTLPESTDAPDRKVEGFVIFVLVKKLLKKQPAHLRRLHHVFLVDLLGKASLEHFTVTDGVRLKPKNIRKLGKAVARDLMHEYRGALNVVLTAMGVKSTEFQESAMKHLNIRLNAFNNRPKSGLGRFFSRWDKAH